MRCRVLWRAAPGVTGKDALSAAHGQDADPAPPPGASRLSAAGTGVTRRSRWEPTRHPTASRVLGEAAPGLGTGGVETGCGREGPGTLPYPEGGFLLIPGNDEKSFTFCPRSPPMHFLMPAKQAWTGLSEQPVERQKTEPF